LFKNGQSGLGKGNSLALTEVTEFPPNAFQNDYRNQRLLNKGCHRLLNMVKKHGDDLGKKRNSRVVSFSKTNEFSIDPIKLSLMTTRSNNRRSPLLQDQDFSTMQGT